MGGTIWDFKQLIAYSFPSRLNSCTILHYRYDVILTRAHCRSLAYNVIENVLTDSFSALTGLTTLFVARYDFLFYLLKYGTQSSGIQLNYDIINQFIDVYVASSDIVS